MSNKKAIRGGESATAAKDSLTDCSLQCGGHACRPSAFFSQAVRGEGQDRRAGLFVGKSFPRCLSESSARSLAE